MRQVRKLFASPARIADSDYLRREVASRMHERLALIKIQPTRVLDVGCGDGADLSLLQEQYPVADVIGVDGSPQQLATAASRQRGAVSAMHRMLGKWLPSKIAPGLSLRQGMVCGDFGRLPLGNACSDLIWSNLALHWHPQPDQVFAEWRRVLRVDGLLMFSCFGPDTFKELRAAFAEVDSAPHALSFVDMHDFGDMLVNAGFSTPVMDMETITVTYDSINKLMTDARAWGGNPLLTRRRGLMGRDAWSRTVDALTRMRRDDGKFPLTFEVVYGHAFKPTPVKTLAGEAIVRFDMPRQGRR